ncbi:MAG: DUF1080 domain-containing protein [Planctomycetales bacterium]|nr:DUF1080 domain-containing protein [Planctomycetales bacterium]
MNHLPRLIALLSTIAIGFAAPSYVGAQDDLKPMFVDAQLSGWVRTNTPESTWRFEDGVLYCTGKPIGEIRTEKMYQNFVMELEWRHMVPRGNAGVFVWADDITSRGVPFHRGIEVQVLENSYGNNNSHTTHGDIFPIHGATMTPINGRGGSRAFPTESRSNPSPQWNHYRIECRDGEISLAVNGKVVTRGKDCVPRKGYICLESEGGVVEYRNVKIKELPGEDVLPEQVAISNRGYHSIYTGLDLDGWQTDETSLWKVQDWVLAFEGTKDQESTLTTSYPYDNVRFVVDVRLKQTDSSVKIQVAPNLIIDLADSNVAKHLEKNGSWNRIELAGQVDNRHLEINGQRVGENLDLATSGPLVLHPTGPVDFANIYVTQ